MSSTFQRLGSQQSAQKQPQDPRAAAIEMMKQQGISIPEGMENNPQALLQHVLQSGKVPAAQNRLSMAQQMMSKMFGRKR